MTKKKPGPPKGVRYGGRQKGTPNKLTEERERQAREEFARLQKRQVGQAEGRAEQLAESLEAAPGDRRKLGRLGKDILDEMANLFFGLSAYYQPYPPPRKNLNEDEKKFHRYSKLALEAASRAAEFQSPKFKAVLVGAAVGGNAPETPPALPAPAARVVELDDPASLAKFYQRIVTGSATR